jgi:hypothetical protein
MRRQEKWHVAAEPVLGEQQAGLPELSAWAVWAAFNFGSNPPQHGSRLADSGRSWAYKRRSSLICHGQDIGHCDLSSPAETGLPVMTAF